MVFILKSHNECHDVEKKRQSSFRRKECNGDRLNKKRTINQFYVTSLSNCPEGTIIVTLLTKKRMKVIDHKINGIRSWRRSFVSFCIVLKLVGGLGLFVDGAAFCYGNLCDMVP